jgi:hypothetical protein
MYAAFCIILMICPYGLVFDQAGTFSIRMRAGLAEIECPQAATAAAARGSLGFLFLLRDDAGWHGGESHITSGLICFSVALNDIVVAQFRYTGVFGKTLWQTRMQFSSESSMPTDCQPAFSSP